MVTLVGKETDILDTISHLIRLDYAAIEAYQEAIEHLNSEYYRNQMQQFCSDHERHTQNLARFLEVENRDVPERSMAKSMLTQGKVILANMAGDEAILGAMRTNEKDTNTAYMRAAQHEDCTMEMRQVILANLADERRHLQWLERQLSEDMRDARRM